MSVVARFNVDAYETEPGNTMRVRSICFAALIGVGVEKAIAVPETYLVLGGAFLGGLSLLDAVGYSLTAVFDNPSE
ncbi:hypothetical protein [Halomicrococcus gelatinilyticus]|uniref:hypothetical protein n=1 Tax=Halomicrococcus gelatinilyticus TaxID=1702103 RepID=UPI002E0DDF76